MEGRLVRPGRIELPTPRLGGNQRLSVDRAPLGFLCISRRASVE